MLNSYIQTHNVKTVCNTLNSFNYLFGFVKPTAMKFLCLYVYPVTDWQLVLGVPYLLLYDRWNRLNFLLNG